jgi:hypothetical protein
MWEFFYTWNSVESIEDPFGNPWHTSWRAHAGSRTSFAFRIIAVLRDVEGYHLYTLDGGSVFLLPQLCIM